MRRPAFFLLHWDTEGISGGPVVKTQRSQCRGIWVRSLVRELWYHQKKKKVHWDTLRGIKADHGEKHSLRGSAPLHKPGPFSTGENLKLSGTGLNTQRSEDKIPSQHLSIPISAWESKSPLNSDENSEEKNVMDIQR